MERARAGSTPSARSARSRSRRSRAEWSALHEQRADDVEHVAALEVRVPALEADAAEAQSLFESRALVQLELEERTTAVASQRRELDVREAAVDERRRVLAHRLAEVEDRLARDPERRAEAERHRLALERRGTGYGAVGARLEARPRAIDELPTRCARRAACRPSGAAAASGQLDALRARAGRAERELLELREHRQRREVEEAETRLRLETAVERIRTDFDCEPGGRARRARARGARGHDARRARRASSSASCGSWARSTRSRSRSTTRCSSATSSSRQQLDDVKNSRRELHRVIKAVDEEIVTVFERRVRRRAAENFSELFTTLFPGGSGRLVLTDPDDLLNTGIEMEARPSGKNVRRLSLLSGGERSLTALAFLFAVFRARPSPFYLMDEVEAALDDVNLHRFLDLVHEFRDEAQLLIVSHQKRTMEAGRLPLRRLDAAGRLEPGREPAHARRPAGGLTSAVIASRGARRIGDRRRAGRRRAARRASSRGSARRSTDLTGTPRAADVADALAEAAPHRRRSSLVAWIVGADRAACSSAAFVQHAERRRRDGSASIARRACSLVDTGADAERAARAARRDDRRGAAQHRHAIADLGDRGRSWCSTSSGVNLAPLHRRRGHRRRRARLRRAVARARLPLGLFMLIEDQYGVGDVIDTGVATGTVEGVSLRTTAAARRRRRRLARPERRDPRASATSRSSGRARCVDVAGRVRRRPRRARPT